MTCYRHPDRQAGRRCTRCGKPACPSCLVQATVGSHCVDCAKAAKPDIKTRARFWSAGQHNLVTMSLIVANLAVFVGVLLWTRDTGALTIVRCGSIGSTSFHALHAGPLLRSTPDGARVVSLAGDRGKLMDPLR